MCEKHIDGNLQGTGIGRDFLQAMRNLQWNNSKLGFALLKSQSPTLRVLILGQLLSKFNMYNHLEGLLKHKCWNPHFWFNNLGRCPKCAFLEGSQLILMVLVWEPHFKNHCIIPRRSDCFGSLFHTIIF